MTETGTENSSGPLRPLLIRPGEGGLRRNQLIDPRPGLVRADVEDDMHRFTVEIEHDGTFVTDFRAEALRWPWSTCPMAATHLSQRMKGARLAALADVDSPYSHCTHMLDLTLLAAAHALDDAPTLYSCFASDETEPTQHAELYCNGRREIVWELRNSEIVSPGPRQGLSLRKLKVWEADLSPTEREQARVLRRAVFISGGRGFSYDVVPTADLIPQSVGACFTFQPERSPQAACTMDVRDYREGPAPLAERIAQVAQERGLAG